MEFYKNRTIQLKERVKVYFNLHKNVFSVVAMEGEHKGKVVAHTSRIKLSDCVFRVNESGRQRVLKEKQKNVHAFVFGLFEGIETQQGEKAYYNPYLYKSFMKDNEKPLFEYPNVSLENKKIYLNE